MALTAGVVVSGNPVQVAVPNRLPDRDDRRKPLAQAGPGGPLEARLIPVSRSGYNATMPREGNYPRHS